MTTIACDGKMIAADGVVAGNGIIHDRARKKLWRLKDGRVAGFSGSPFAVGHAVDYLNGDRESFDAKEYFEAIILGADGVVHCMDEHGRMYERPAPCVSGSGGGIALGAMLAGKNAYDAVRIAAEFDTSSGGVCCFMKPERAGETGNG